MIKGVNRQIIEVMDTGNPYFERALLVVRPAIPTRNRPVCGRRPSECCARLAAMPA